MSTDWRAPAEELLRDLDTTGEYGIRGIGRGDRLWNLARLDLRGAE